MASTVRTSAFPGTTTLRILHDHIFKSFSQRGMAGKTLGILAETDGERLRQAIKEARGEDEHEMHREEERVYYSKTATEIASYGNPCGPVTSTGGS